MPNPTATDVLSPIGQIEPSMFPGEDLTTLTARLTVYINEGIAKVAARMQSDTEPGRTAAIIWAYYRAYLAAYLLLSAQPSTESAAGVSSTTYTSIQIRTFKLLSDDALAAFTSAMTVPPVPPPFIQPETPGSMAIGNSYTW